MRPTITDNYNTDKNKSKTVAVEMRFLRKIEKISKLDKLRNETVINQLSFKPIRRIIEERQLGCLGQVHRTGDDGITKKIYRGSVPGKNEIGRPLRTW